MPFKEFPQPNVHHWKPDENFDHHIDRLHVATNWHDFVVLAWTTDDRSDGGLIVAPEAVPENVTEHFRGYLEPFEYARDEKVQPYLYVNQLDDGRLEFRLAHPMYEGSFETSGSVLHIRPTLRNLRRRPDSIAGYTRPVTEHKRVS